jgi:hypothetical protein
MTEKMTETQAEAIHRLALQAEKRGIRIHRYGETTFATSVSRHGDLHRVTPWGCDCLGFLYHGRCSHYAAFLADQGALPPVPCAGCRGDGRITYPVRITSDGKTVYDAAPCGLCHGTGIIDAHAA